MSKRSMRSDMPSSAKKATRPTTAATWLLACVPKRCSRVSGVATASSSMAIAAAGDIRSAPPRAGSIGKPASASAATSAASAAAMQAETGRRRSAARKLAASSSVPSAAPGGIGGKCAPRSRSDGEVERPAPQRQRGKRGGDAVREMRGAEQRPESGWVHGSLRT